VLLKIERVGQLLPTAVEMFVESALLRFFGRQRRRGSNQFVEQLQRFFALMVRDSKKQQVKKQQAKKQQVKKQQVKKQQAKKQQVKKQQAKKQQVKKKQVKKQQVKKQQVIKQQVKKQQVKKQQVKKQQVKSSRCTVEFGLSTMNPVLKNTGNQTSTTAQRGALQANAG
jgi:hypothetical protein